MESDHRPLVTYPWTGKVEIGHDGMLEVHRMLLPALDDAGVKEKLVEIPPMNMQGTSPEERLRSAARICQQHSDAEESQQALEKQRRQKPRNSRRAPSPTSGGPPMRERSP